ncbi:MAG TPA: S8 family serine peptidase [Mycobacteriales bacterium]|jgi:subtilisin family serine protease|nr:S8 family serine peptidase [Mycobacteriales bacterium]
MQRSSVVAAAVAVVLVTGVGVAIARRDGNGRPHAAPTTAPPSPTPTPTTQSPTPSATPSHRPTPVGTGPRDRQYDVVYAAGVSVDDGAAAVAAAGGEVVHENAKVGVATVMAGRDFVARARKDRRVFGVVTNRAFGRPPAEPKRREVQRGTGPRVTRTGPDPLASLQWDMDVIHAPQARATTKGDRRVLVAVIDTGVDGTHPDLAAAYDKELSRNFVTDYPGADGACEQKTCVDPVTDDPNGHGTHVAGTIAAATDEFGIAGIAPNVRLVGLRAGQDSGLFFLMPTVDALVYAADIGVDVANMSYFVDPWLFNCPAAAADDADDRYEQRALIEGVRRATDYAYAHGVTLVAAAGNEHTDLDHKRFDTISPDFPEGAARTRRIDKTCLSLPSELPHVIEVSAVGRDGVKADYSNYGLDHITVAAPGGSTYLADGSGPNPSYQTLSTWPEAVARAEGSVGADGRPRSALLVQFCQGTRCAYYRYLTGTSMASPHAAGVAALVVSRFGTPDPAHPGQLRMDPAKVLAILRSTAVDHACPRGTFDYRGRTSDYAATCAGTATRNAFYGEGIVDARAAVTARG